MEVLPLDIRNDIFKRACMMELMERARPFTDVYYTFLFMDGTIIREKESTVRKNCKEFLTLLSDKVCSTSERVIDDAIEDASYDVEYVSLDPIEDEEQMNEIIDVYLENYKEELKIEYSVHTVKSKRLLESRETYIDVDSRRALDDVLRELMG